MYIVMLSRVIKVNTGTQEKFAPRTANREQPGCIGPFVSRKMAAQAALKAAGTHTCLSAVVTDADGAEQIMKSWRLLSDHVKTPILACIESCRPQPYPVGQ